MCRLYGIPKNGQVMAQIGPDFISVFPAGLNDMQYDLKKVTMLSTDALDEREPSTCRRQYLDMWDFGWTDVISRSYL